jgi:hypothetical protein
MPAPDELSVFIDRLESIGALSMVTGGTAAILYGQPRVTNDIRRRAHLQRRDPWRLDPGLSGHGLLSAVGCGDQD